MSSTLYRGNSAHSISPDNTTPVARKSHIPRPVSDSKKDMTSTTTSTSSKNIFAASTKIPSPRPGSISPLKKQSLSPTKMTMIESKNNTLTGTPQHLLKTLSRLTSPDTVPPPAPQFKPDVPQSPLHAFVKSTKTTPTATKNADSNQKNLIDENSRRKSIGGLIGGVSAHVSLLENENPPEDLDQPSFSNLSHISDPKILGGDTNSSFFVQNDMTHTENVSFEINESAISHILDSSDLSPGLDISMGDEMYLTVRKLIKEVKDKVTAAENLYEKNRTQSSKQLDKEKEEYEKQKADTIRLINSHKEELSRMQQSLQKAKEDEEILRESIKYMEEKLSLAKTEMESREARVETRPAEQSRNGSTTNHLLPLIMIVLILLGISELFAFYLYISYKREYASGRDPSQEIEGGQAAPAWIVRVFDRFFSFLDILSGSWAASAKSSAPF